jgi:hypothetical protein
MKTLQGRGNPRFAAAIAACLLYAAQAAADPKESEGLKSELSRTSVTTLPAYTVDEPISAKTHTLFMGAEIAINLDRDVYPVRDVTGSNWVIDIHGQQKEISSKQAPVNLKITPTLKLTEVSATIDGFKRVQAYSFANDPSVRLTRGLTQAAVTNSMLVGVANDARNLAETASNNALGGAAILASGDKQFGAGALLLTAETSPAMMHPPPVVPGSSTPPINPLADVALGDGQQLAINQANQASAVAQSNTASGNEATGRISTPGLDALDIEFDIRSAKILQDPYVVTMTKFRVPGAKKGMVQNMVFAKSLHPIDEHKSHIHFVEEGFPYDYELLEFQLHLYNRGQEIATNVASDRVELTRDEAFEYVKMEYVSAHLKDTLPAVPAMAKLPADLPSRLAQGKYREAFYVKVSKDGLADEAYSDPACTRRIDDPYLDSIVKRIRFKPALNKGKSVDGVASLELGKLAI